MIIKWGLAKDQKQAPAQHNGGAAIGENGPMTVVFEVDDSWPNAWPVEGSQCLLQDELIEAECIVTEANIHRESWQDANYRNHKKPQILGHITVNKLQIKARDDMVDPFATLPPSEGAQPIVRMRGYVDPQLTEEDDIDLTEELK
jgi:hypothetical protein